MVENPKLKSFSNVLTTCNFTGVPTYGTKSLEYLQGEVRGYEVVWLNDALIPTLPFTSIYEQLQCNDDSKSLGTLSCQLYYKQLRNEDEQYQDLRVCHRMETHRHFLRCTVIFQLWAPRWLRHGSIMLCCRLRMINVH